MSNETPEFLKNAIARPTERGMTSNHVEPANGPVLPAVKQPVGQPFWQEPKRLENYFSGMQWATPGTFQQPEPQRQQMLWEAWQRAQRPEVMQGVMLDQILRGSPQPIRMDYGAPKVYALPSETVSKMFGDVAASFQTDNGLTLVPEETLSAIQRESQYQDQYQPPAPGTGPEQDMIHGMPAEAWNALPQWQRTIIPILPALNTGIGVVSGGMMGTALLGPGVGTVLGAAGMGGLTKLSESNQKIANVLNVLDMPAEGLERTVGVIAQIGMSLQDPDTYGPVGEILANLPAAWQAGHLLYNVADIGSLRYDQETGTTTIENWQLGQAEPQTWTVEDDKSASGLALAEARRRIANAKHTGETTEEIWNDISSRYGFAGEVREMIGHMLMDPLNVIGDISNATGETIARKLGKVELAESFRAHSQIAQAGENFRAGLAGNYDWRANLKPGSIIGDVLMPPAYRNDIIDALRDYGLKVRRLPQAEAARLSSFERWLGDLNREGLPYLYDQSKRKGLAGIAYMMMDSARGLDPKSRAMEMLNQTINGIKIMIGKDGTYNPDYAIRMLAAIAKMEPTDAIKALDASEIPTWVNSVEAQMIPQAIHDQMKGIIEHYNTWRMYEQPRQRINEIASDLEIDPYRLIKELHQATPENAEATLRALIEGKIGAMAEAGDRAAQAKLEAYLDPNDPVSPAKLKQAADYFADKDGAAFDPKHWTIKALLMVEEGLEEWAAKWFNVKPPHWAVRTGNLIKKAQSHVLLGLNPAFFLNNAINNIVNLAYDGLLGMSPTPTRRKWLAEMGLEPTRLRAGASAAELGELGENVKLGRYLHKASKGNGLIDKATESLEAVDKFALFSQMSQKNEMWASEIAYTNAMMQFWDRNWREGVGFEAMPADLARVLDDAMGPGTAKRVMQLVRRGKNKQQIEKAIFKDFRKASVRDVLDPTGIELLDHFPGALEALDKAIGEATSVAEIRKAFADTRARVLRAAGDAIIEARKKIVSEAMAKVQVEGFSGMAEIADDLNATRFEFWYKHLDRMHDAAEAAERAATSQEASLIWKSAMEEANLAWTQFQNIEGFKWLGMFKAFDEHADAASDLQAMALRNLEDQHHNWRYFFQRRQELWEEYRNTWSDMKPSERKAKRKAINDELNREYISAILEEDRLQAELDELVARGAQMVGVADFDVKAWRLKIREARRRMVAANVLYRTGKLPKEMVDAWGKGIMPAELANAIRAIFNDTDSRRARETFWQEIYQKRLLPEMYDREPPEAPGPMPTNEPPFPIDEGPAGVPPTPQPRGGPTEGPVPEYMKMAKEAGIVDRRTGEAQPNYLLNVINKYLVEIGQDEITMDQLGRIDRTTVASAIEAHHARVRERAQQVQQEQTIDVEAVKDHLRETADAIEWNTQALEGNQAVRWGREAIMKEVYDHLGDQAEAIETIFDALQDHALRNGSDFYGNVGIIRGGSIDFWRPTKHEQQRWHYNQLVMAADRLPATIEGEDIPGRGIRQQVLDLLGSSMTQSEMRWSGLDEWLQAWEGTGKPITKGDVLNYLRSNLVQLRETTSGEGNREFVMQLMGRNDPEEGIPEAWGKFQQRMIDKYGSGWLHGMTQAEAAEYRRLERMYYSAVEETQPELIHIRTTDRFTPDGRKVLEVEETGGREENGLIDHSTMEELAIKRITRLAADEGYDYVAFTTGDDGTRDHVGRFVKQWGSKIEEITVDGEARTGISVTPAMREDAMSSIPLYQRMAGAENAATLDKVLADLNEIGFVPIGQIAEIMGNRMPEYLAPVAQFMTEQRKKLTSGTMTVRDIAKAQLLTAASQGASEISVKAFMRKLADAGIEMDLPEKYQLATDRGMYIRPEEAMAAWLMGRNGKDALDALERGQFKAELWDEARQVRQVFGDDRLRTLNLFGQAAPGKYNLTNLAEITDSINQAGKRLESDPAAIHEIGRLVRKLNGVGQGKEGFIKHLIGIGNAPTIDAVEINVWLTGKADTRHMDDVRSGIVREIKGYTYVDTNGKTIEVPGAIKRKDVQDWLTDGVFNGFKKLRDEYGIGASLDEGIFQHLMHHWLWDKAKGTTTTHAGMYEAQALAQNVKGFTYWLDNAKAVMHIFEAGDVSTFAHEAIHAYTPLMTDSDAAIVAKWYNDQYGGDVPDNWHKITQASWINEEGIPDQLRDVNEKFARAFERYWIEGPTAGVKYPNAIERVFEKMKAWLLRIYYSLKNKDINVKMTEDIRNLFDRWMGAEGEAPMLDPDVRGNLPRWVDEAMMPKPQSAAEQMPLAQAPARPDMVRLAQERLGTTNDLLKAGFVDVEGKLLDLSNGRTRRVMQHSYAAGMIYDDVKLPFFSALTRFFEDTNAIRIAYSDYDAEQKHLILDMQVPMYPNRNQLSAIEDAAYRMGARSIDLEAEVGVGPMGSVILRKKGIPIEDMAGEIRRAFGNQLYQEQNWYYSQLLRTVEQAMPKRATKEQIRGILKGRVKEEELRWTGFYEWLDEQSGLIEKQAVLDYLAENQVEIIDSVKADIRIEDKLSKAEADYAYRMLDESIEAKNVLKKMVDKGWQPIPTGNPNKLFDWKNLATGEIHEVPEAQNLWGLANIYLEMAMDYVMRYQTDILHITGEPKWKWLVMEGEATDYTETLLRLGPNKRVEGTFTHNHWGSEENILVHVRHDTRIGKDGERNLFINEVQSDWHQIGRREGYRGAYQEPNAVEIGDGLWEYTDTYGNKGYIREQRRKDWVRTGMPIPPEEWIRGNVFDQLKPYEVAPGIWEIVGPDWEDPTKQIAGAVMLPSKESALMQIEEWKMHYVQGGRIEYVVEYRAKSWTFRKFDYADEFIRRQMKERWLKGKDGQVPEAPFGPGDDKWSTLAMKRMIRKAAEDGYDRISWVTGQQAARLEGHPLVTDLDTITYNSKTHQLSGIKNGKEVVYRILDDESELGDYIGDDAARQLISAPVDKYGVYTLRTENIQFGGEKMRWFYDRNLVNNVNKYIKKWGVTVEDYAIDEGVTVHSFQITPRMRQDALAGQPLFQVGVEDRAMTPEELRLYARALIRAGVDEARRAVNYEPDLKRKVNLLDALYEQDPELAKQVARQTVAKKPLLQGDDVWERIPLEPETPRQAATPNRTFAFVDDERIPMRFKVVSLDDLIASHTEDFQPNQAYPSELQPRAREATGYREQVMRIAANLDERALIDTHYLDTGPAIVTPENIVVNGNGRTMAMRIARRDYAEVWAKYQDELRNHLKDYGLSEEDLTGIKDPVLVRVVEDDQNLATLSQRAQAGQSAGLSDIEQAAVDAQAIDVKRMANLMIGNNENLADALRDEANAEIVTAWLRKLPESDQPKLIDNNRKLNAAGMKRLVNAMFELVFPGEAGTRMNDIFVNTKATGLANLRDGIYDALGELARMESMIKAGIRSADLAIGEDIIKAVDVLERLRSQGKTVGEYLQQQTMIDRELNPFQEQLLRFISDNASKRSMIADVLKGYARSVIESEAAPEQGALFAGAAPSKGEILDQVAQKAGKVTEFSKVAGREAESVPNWGEMFPADDEAPATTTKAPGPKPLEIEKYYFFNELRDIPRPLSGYTGNKRTMLQAGHYDYLVTDDLVNKIDEIWEAFGGSGLLGSAFQEMTGKPRMYNEYDPSVANFHIQARDHTNELVSKIESVIGELRQIMDRYPKGGTRAKALVRAWWRETAIKLAEGSDIDQAALMLLNYSSLGSYGKFAVMNERARWTVNERTFANVIKAVRDHAAVMKKGDIRVGDARQVLAMADEKKLVLLDPPYVQRSTIDERVTGYNAGQDLSTIEGGVEFIRRDMADANARGVPMIYTNNAHPDIMNALEEEGFHTRVRWVRSGQDRRYEVIAWNDAVGPADTGDAAKRTAQNKREMIERGLVVEQSTEEPTLPVEQPTPRWPTYTETRKQPRRPQQAPGTTASLFEPPLEEGQWEGYIHNLGPVLDQAERQMIENQNVPHGIMNWNEAPPDVMRAMRSWLGRVNTQMADTKIAAMRWGEAKRDFALLNYARRYGFDNWLGAGIPYEFWYLRSMRNWLMRSVARPALYTNMARMNELAKNQIEREGFPYRLRKKAGIAIPGLPDWMGESVFIDPMRQLYPPLMLNAPFERLSEQNNQLKQRTIGILNQWLSDESENPGEIERALQTQRGYLWNKAVATAKNEMDLEIQNPLDFAFMMSAPSLPLSIAYNYATGRKERISQLPITRGIQALTGALGIGGPRGWNIESGLRQKLGLPEVDMYEDYRVDSMLAYMTAEGIVTPHEALQAMIDRHGAAFEAAQRRVSAMGVWKYFGAPLGVDFFPEGEQEQRQLRAEYDRAIRAWKGGDNQALAKFFDAYPEYEARLASFKEPEERLRRFIISEVWDRYNRMPSVHKEQARDQLGDVFRDAFLNKETRSYDSISTETLAMWARALDQLTPLPDKAPETPAISLRLAPKEVAEKVDAYWSEARERFPGIGEILNWFNQLSPEQQQEAHYQYPQIDRYYRWKNQYLAEHPDIIPWVTSETSELFGLPQDLQQAVYNYRAQRDQLFPGIDQMQNEYYSIRDKEERSAYLRTHPALREYWDWRKAMAAANPKAAPYILSDQALANAILYNQAPGLSQETLQKISPTTLRQLYAMFYSGDALRAGAYAELMELWESLDRPYGSLQAWIGQEVRPSLTGR